MPQYGRDYRSLTSGTGWDSTTHSGRHQMLRKLSKCIGKLNDEASATMILWIPIVLMASLFLWIGLGKVFDSLSQFQYSFAAANPQMPVSADRVWITGAFTTGYTSLLIFSILMPVLVFSIIVAKRRIDGQI